MPILLLSLAVLSLSQAANLVRWAEAPLEVIGLWRMIFAFFIVLPFTLPIKAQLKTLSTKLLGHALFSGVFLFLHLFAFFYAAKNTTIANTMILFSTHPLFTAVLAWLFYGEKPQKRIVFSYLLAGASVTLLFYDSIQFSRLRLLADSSALASALFFSAYMLTGRSARKSIPNLLYSLILYVTAGLGFLLSTQIQNHNLIGFSNQTWLAIVLLTLFPTLLGHALFTYLLKTLDLHLLSCMKLIEPSLSAFTAYLFFHEKIGQNTIVSFLLTAVSILILLVPEIKNFRIQNS